MKKMIPKTLIVFAFSVVVFLVINLMVPKMRFNQEQNIADTDFLTLQTQLKQHVNFLTTLSPSRSSENTVSLDKAADYIYSTLKQMGYSPKYQSYTVKAQGSEQTYHNITALYGDPTKPRIVVGAHYDVCIGEVIDPTAIVPGADDNASGVAGLLELARRIQTQKNILDKYAIEFVAYTLEEPPYFRTTNMGSYIHASDLSKQKIDVKLMISLEMIGYFSVLENSQRYPINFAMKDIYGHQGNYIAVIGDLKQLFVLNKVQALFNTGTTLPMYRLSAPASLQGIDWSDHRNYWTFGYPAVIITDTSYLRNRNYHKLSDTADTLNFEKMAQVVLGTEALLLKYE